MASLVKQFSGRKRSHSVWTYFKYDEKQDKSRCIVVSSKGSACDVLVATKNATNLKNHLRIHHKEIYKELEDIEKEQKEQSRSSKISKNTAASSESSHTQSLHDCLGRTVTQWNKQSSQYMDRVKAVRDMIIKTGYPVTYVDQPIVRSMFKTLDTKFALPGSAKMQNLIISRWKSGVTEVKSVLARARKVTVCLDGWSKSNLTASFLGISVCFYDPVSTKVRHLVLQLSELEHPHTGEVLAEHLERCMAEWGLNSHNVLMVVSDNGSNMTKAVRLLNDWHVQCAEGGSGGFEETGHGMDTKGLRGEGDPGNVSGSESADNENDGNVLAIASECDTDTDVTTEGEGEEESEVGSDVELIELADIHDVVPYQRLMCMAHSLQLVIKKAYTYYDRLLIKVRYIAGKVKKSSVAVSKLKKETGKVLLSDNNTRWNSTYRMVERLIQVKDAVNGILAEQKADTLLVSEWSRLSELCELLKPFAVQTDKLQGNCNSLSYVIPALLELECHLLSCSAPKVITKTMLDDMQKRFQCIRDPSCQDFTALPAAACLLDPSVASVLMTADMKSLLEAATEFIISQAKRQPYSQNQQAQQSVTTSTSTSTTALKGFPLLAAKLAEHQQEQPSQGHATSTALMTRPIRSHINQYIADIHTHSFDSSAVDFWRQKEQSNIYSVLTLIAQDLISAPSSQAFVERLFSVCGMLTVGRRNRMDKSLNMRAWLKVNHDSLVDMGM